MEIRLLGKETTGGDSPTLYATDHGTYLIQGWVVTNPEIVANLDISQDDTYVEIYARLLEHLAKDGLSGELARRVPPIVHVMPDGNLIVQGRRVTDPPLRAKMALPANEDCVEVPRAALAALLQEENDFGADDPPAT